MQFSVPGSNLSPMALLGGPVRVETCTPPDPLSASAGENERTEVMATCPNGHPNPDNQEFCRECGAPIMSAVAICPYGHINPEHAHFCEQCGAPISAPVAAVAPSPETRPRYRKKWLIAVASIVTLAVIAGGVVAAVVLTKSNGPSSSAPTTSAATAIKNWWSGAKQDFADLQNAIADEKAARAREDWPAAFDACRRMHETAANKLQSHLPSPDPELTADLQGAINDAEIAAHMCLSAEAGSYVQAGDFTNREDQADKQMRAAQDIVNKTLTEG